MEQMSYLSMIQGLGEGPARNDETDVDWHTGSVFIE